MKTMLKVAKRAAHTQVQRTVAAPPAARCTIADGFKFGVHPGLKQKSVGSLVQLQGQLTHGVPSYDHTTLSVEWGFGHVAEATKGSPEYDHHTAPIEWGYGATEGQTKAAPECRIEGRAVEWSSHTELGEEQRSLPRAASKPDYSKRTSVDGTSYPLHPGLEHAELGEDRGGVLEGRPHMVRAKSTTAIPEYSHLETADGAEYRPHPMLRSMSIDPLSTTLPPSNPLVIYAKHAGHRSLEMEVTSSQSASDTPLTHSNYHHGCPEPRNDYMSQYLRAAPAPSKVVPHNNFHHG